MVIHMKFCQGILGYCPLNFKLSMNVSVLSHKLASNRRNFMKLILSIYDHGVMMHVKLHKDVIGCREVIAL